MTTLRGGTLGYAEIVALKVTGLFGRRHGLVLLFTNLFSSSLLLLLLVPLSFFSSLLLPSSPLLPYLSVSLSVCAVYHLLVHPLSLSLSLLPSLPLPSPRLPTAQSSMRVHEYTNHHHVSNLSPCPRSS